jgi:hypothetical protein
MALRYLFYVASSLLSGSAVAALFTVLVLHFFPDPTDHQKPSVVKLEAHQDVRSAEQPEPSIGSTGPVTQPATQGSVERATAGTRTESRQTQAALETAPDPLAQQDPVAIVRSNREPSWQQRHPEPTVLTQDGSHNREQVFSVLAATDMPVDSVQEPTPSKAAPDPAHNRIKSQALLKAQVSAQERKPEPGPISRQNSRDGKSTIATSLAAGDVHARAAAGGRATQAGLAFRGPHADHARRGQIGHPGDHRRPIRHISLGQ